MSETSSRTCDVLSHFISVGQQFGEYVHNKEKKLAQQQIKILCMVSAPLIKSVVFYGDAARVFPGDDGQWSPGDIIMHGCAPIPKDTHIIRYDPEDQVQSTNEYYHMAVRNGQARYERSLVAASDRDVPIVQG